MQLLPDAIILVVRHDDDEPLKVIQETVPAAQQGERLKQLVSEHKLSGSLVNLVLSTQQYKSYLIDRPAVPEDELAEASKWRIKDMLDFRVEDATVDVFCYPDEALRGRSAQLNVRVAQSETVARYLDILRDAGLEPNEITSADLALASALISQVTDDTKVSVLLHLTDRYGLLVLVKEGQLYLARDFEFQFASLRDPSQQERKLDQLTLEVQRSFDYFESQMGLASPNVLKLSAPESMLPLENMIGGSLGILVESFSFGALAVGPSSQQNTRLNQSATYAFGALLGMDDSAYAVNFYGETFKLKIPPLSLPQLVLACAAVVIMVIGAHFLLANQLENRETQYSLSQGDLNAMQQQVSVLAEEAQAMKIDENLKTENDALGKEIEAYRALLNQLGSQQDTFKFLYSDLFKSLAKHTPEKLWLTEFEADRSMGRLYINGETVDAAQIPVFLEGLQSESLFSQKTFESLKLVQHAEDKRRYVFSLRSIPEGGGL